MSNGNWHKDKVFTDWLLRAKYANETKKGIHPVVGLGLVLYMYEAFLLGRAQK